MYVMQSKPPEKYFISGGFALTHANSTTVSRKDTAGGVVVVVMMMMDVRDEVVVVVFAVVGGEGGGSEGSHVSNLASYVCTSTYRILPQWRPSSWKTLMAMLSPSYMLTLSRVLVLLQRWGGSCSCFRAIVVGGGGGGGIGIDD